jgi:nuclear pore complex protein Nup62
LIASVAKKYNVANPLTESSPQHDTLSGFGKSGPAAPTPAQLPFSPSTNPSPFTTSGSLNSTQNATISKPFASAGSSEGGGFKTQSTSRFGTSQTTSTSSSLGVPAPAPTPFGSTTTASSPFGSLAGTLASMPSPFGSTTSSSTPFDSQAGTLAIANPFGAPAPFGASASTPPTPAGSERLFNGRTAKELLTEFYRAKCPEKLSQVESNLKKYQGNEEQMFQKLAHKVCCIIV